MLGLFGEVIYVLEYVYIYIYDMHVRVLYDLHMFSTQSSGLHPQVGSDAVVLKILLGNAQSFSR